MPSVIVWDIETIPDTEGYARANGLTGHSEDEIRSKMGAKFPKPPYHKIVCIGIMIAEQVNGIWEARSVEAPHIGEMSERDIIKRFLNKIDELEPQLITYNGSSFDFPVLRYRAMHHQLKRQDYSQDLTSIDIPMMPWIYAMHCHLLDHLQR